MCVCVPSRTIQADRFSVFVVVFGVFFSGGGGLI